MNESSAIWPSALYAAAYRGHDRLKQILLEKGDVVDQTTGYSELGATIYSAKGTAVYSAKHTAVTKILLQHGADVSAHDKFAGFPLTAAAANGDQDVLNLLIAKGALVDAVGQNLKTALQTAIANEHVEIVDILLRHDADVNVQGNPCGSPLIAACTVASHANAKRFVQKLLNRGADVNLQVTEGEHFDAPLTAAIARGHGEIVEMLLAHGANINQVGTKYPNALVAVCLTCRDVAMAKQLLKHGADLDFKSQGLLVVSYGRRALIADAMLPG